MATHHGGSGQPLDRDINAHKAMNTDTEQTQDFYHVNTNDFKESEPNNPTRLTTITRELEFMPASPSWRRTNLRSSKSHRMQITKTVHITLPISTIGTS